MQIILFVWGGGGFDRTGSCDWRPLPTIDIYRCIYAWFTFIGPVVMVFVFFYVVCVLRTYYNDSFSFLVIDTYIFQVSWGSLGRGGRGRFGGVVDFVLVGRGCLFFFWGVLA